MNMSLNKKFYNQYTWADVLALGEDHKEILLAFEIYQDLHALIIKEITDLYAPSI